MDLPALSDKPQHYADCCLSLSTVLLDHLKTVLQASVTSGLILSIGSGTGLLEVLLLHHLEDHNLDELRIEAVEVKSHSTTLNSYLREELTHVLSGSWEISPRANRASALLFVYPRATALVRNYLELYSQSNSRLKLVLWLGPKMDWNDYESLFNVPGFDPVEIVDQCGLTEYEIMAVLKRR